MLETPASLRGMVTSPHHLGSQAGLAVLREGRDAIEAAIAVAATLAVVYPHMTGIGGDGFWLISRPGGEVIGIDACGAAAANADLALYRRAGFAAAPWRGPLAANTVAGAVSGWDLALSLSAGALPRERLLAEAIHHAERGVAVARGWADTARAKDAELRGDPGYASVFRPHGGPLQAGETLRQPALANTLRRLAASGFQDFYDGGLARDIASDLATAGSPLSAGDLRGHAARACPPLSATVADATLFNLPPPTQGMTSLLCLALFDRLAADAVDRFDHVHGLVEATKRAFLCARRSLLGDPAHMSADPQALLNDTAALDAMAADIDPGRALPWPHVAQGGDTTWFGVIDEAGLAVSAIQSTYFEFGAGVVLPRTGIVWQNRGASFTLAESGWNALAPGRKPFHTLNPALAHFDDGRVMVYGTMGGEGQPQTQAAIFSRYARFGVPLQEAITAPRWLLGRTWGEESATLKLENRFSPELSAALRAAGHEVEILPSFSALVGHAGALVRFPQGRIEGASDPRSDGSVAAW